MRTLFSKILLAQVVTVVLALLVVTLITRASLNRGFKEFLGRQETGVLQTLAPALADFYEERESWVFLSENPLNWQRIWRHTRGPQGGPPRGGPGQKRGRPRDDTGVPLEPPVDTQMLRWMRSPDRGMLRERLFLLDEERTRIAGAKISDLEGISLEAIEVNGQVVGWIGFTPMGKELPPDAERFMSGQIRISAISLAMAMIVAAALAFLLAGTVSRPVRRLGTTVGKLSRGEYFARAQVETKDEIGVLAEHVNQLAASLEKNRTARQRWMADIAHELRTPVSILKGEIEALADGVRPADGRMSASLREEVDQLSALIDDLQTLAMSDAGALNIRKEPVDFTSLINQCLEAFGDRLATRGITVDKYLPDQSTLSADPTRLRQLLHNLLENSSRYVNVQGQVRITLTENVAETELVLEDSGPGLADEQIEHLFDRFYRVEGSRARSSGGSGLGLAICKNIVEAHGGTIQAGHSEMGGLKMQITLPVRGS